MAVEGFCRSSIGWSWAILADGQVAKESTIEKMKKDSVGVFLYFWVPFGEGVNSKTRCLELHVECSQLLFTQLLHRGKPCMCALHCFRCLNAQ